MAPLIAAGFSVPAHGMHGGQHARTCSTRDDVLKKFLAKYAEQPTALGLTTSGALVEVLTSENGETWTMIFTLPSGITCLVAVGEQWQRSEFIPVSEKS